jgi:pyruvate dehydrogenase (quinone)
VRQGARSAVGSHYQQELDLAAILKDVASDFTAVTAVAAQVRHLVDRAVRIALGRRCVTALVIPNDLQEEPMVQPAGGHESVISGVGWNPPVVVPAEGDLHRATEVLNAGRRVALLVGAGARDATDEVIAAADRLGAGTAKRFSASRCCPKICPG